MINIEMSWNEIKTRAKDGCPLSVLAELNGVKANVMKEAIAQLEKETGEKIVWGSVKPKKKKTKKRKTIDREKVVELLKAGRKVPEIADILGCSTPTLYAIQKDFREAQSAAELYKNQTIEPVVEDGRFVGLEKIEIQPEPVAVTKEEIAKAFGIVPEYKEINPEVADQLDRFLDEKIEAIEKELNDQAVVFDRLKAQLDSWIEIKKRVEGTK